jgi:hypothetical protein
MENNLSNWEKTFDAGTKMYRSKPKKLALVIILICLCITFSGFFWELGAYIGIILKNDHPINSTQGMPTLMNLGLSDILPTIELKIYLSSESSALQNESIYTLNMFFPLAIRSYINSYDFGKYIKPSNELTCQPSEKLDPPGNTSATSTLFFKIKCRGQVSPMNAFKLI